MSGQVAPTPMLVDLSGRTALVTGGGTGIGRAISIGLARCGAHVAISYRRSQEAAEGTARQIDAAGGGVSLHSCDVAAEDQVAELAAAVHARAGGLDILVANAGGPVVVGLPTSEVTAQQWAAGMATNCDSVFYCVKHVAPLLSAPGGRIIVTSSISARTGARPGGLNYAAAKGAVNNMVRNWAQELGPRGITVNAIAPGVIRTRIHEEGTPDAVYAQLVAQVPLGRDGQPEDCVGAVLLLASADGGYINGQIIEINGGMLMP